MGEDPQRIRSEIEQTRADIDETVSALGYKADVPSRTKDKMTQAKDAITGKVSGAKDTLTNGASGTSDRISDATPDKGAVKRKAGGLADTAQRNPLGLAIGGIAVGFVAGLLVPSTGVEDRAIGPVADDIKQQAAETGREALERGKEVAQETVQSAKDTAQEKAGEHGEALAGSAQESAQQVRSNAADD